MGRYPAIPAVLINIFQQIEPDAQFVGSLPRIESSSGQQYFAKLGSSNESEHYVGETESLKAIDTAAPGLVPKVFASGSLDVSEGAGRPYFVSEYKDLGSLTETSGGILGKRLATELHRYKSSKGFGFEVPTFCGATRLRNGWYESWERCFDAMIGDLLETLSSQGRYKDLCEKGKQIRGR